MPRICLHASYFVQNTLLVFCDCFSVPLLFWFAFCKFVSICMFACLSPVIKSFVIEPKMYTVLYRCVCYALSLCCTNVYKVQLATSVCVCCFIVYEFSINPALVYWFIYSRLKTFCLFLILCLVSNLGLCLVFIWNVLRCIEIQSNLTVATLSRWHTCMLFYSVWVLSKSSTSLLVHLQ